MKLQPISELTSDKLKQVRLIATDMDGTLTCQGKFTPALLQAFHDLAIAGVTVLVVTGRSAGWVNGLANYLPVAGAIAENGGIFYPTPNPDDSSGEGQLIVPIADIARHRHQLAAMFASLQQAFPQIQESSDNQFRLTDWTFDVAGLSSEMLRQMGDRCQAQGWGFTYSTVQCHIKLAQQDKAPGLAWVLQRFFPAYALEEVVTVGDSPNDASLFDSRQFPLSIGVANVWHYQNRLEYHPTYVTAAPEVEGFCELAKAICGCKSTAPK